jgi:hypothetical protein
LPKSTAPSESSTRALAAGTRVGGLVLALGYLTGWVDGPMVAAVGGLALITFGRALLMNRADQLFAAGTLAVLGGAVGVAALRWGTLDLSELRSVQSVLGPTLLVGPQMVAAGVVLAAIAALVALMVWVAALDDRGLAAWAWTGVEVVVVALALVNAFWGPKVLETSAEIPSSESLPSIAVWVVASGAVVVAAIAGGLLVRLLGVSLRLSLSLSSALVLVVGAGFTVTAL